MIIRLTETINSVCGEYEAAKGEEMRVIKYYDDLAIYYCVSKVNFDPGIVYEACKESAEVVEEEKPVIEKNEFASYNNEKNRIELTYSTDYMGPPKEWRIETRPVEQKPEQEKPTSDNFLHKFQYNDNGKLEPINKELLTEEKKLTTMEIPVGAFEISSGPSSVNEPPSKYHRLNTIKDKEFVDFYDIINLLQSNGEPIPPEIQHALKKLMYNDRGHKNMVQDKKEASWSIDRWLENNEL
jgi:hypothetical protein